MKKIKTLCFIFFLLFFLPICIFASEIETQSSISSVSVYLNSALLTRTAKVELVPGEHQIIFSDIIPNIDENSLRVSAQGTAKAKILGAQLKKEYVKESPAEKVKELEKGLENLSEESKRLNDAHNITISEREWLYSLKLVSGQQIQKDLITKFPAVKDVSEFLKFLDISLKESYAVSQSLDSQLREVDKKMEVLRRQLSEISTPDKLKRSIVVDVQVLKSGNLEVSLSYLVGGAGWFPLYEARAIFEKSEVELVSYGVIRQTTGEAWQDVDAVLSTARPNLSGRLPEVVSNFLSFYEPPRAYKSKGVRMFAVTGSQSMPAAISDEIGGIGGPEELEKNEPAEMAFSQARESGVAVTYRVPHKATIKSDGSDVRLPVSSETLKAQFKYAAYPKMSNFAYLLAKVENSKELQLPAGRTNIFLENDFVASSNIDNIAPGEIFDLSLGVDENVKVKRELVEKKEDDVLIGNISSFTKKITFKYKLTVENFKNKKIDFELFEVMPVSSDERIKVKILDVSFEPKDKDYKDKKGVWRWEFELIPQAKKEIFYTLLVEYPRSRQIEGL